MNIWKRLFRKAARKMSPVPLNSSDDYYCPECKKTVTRKELDSTWDWSGPHCPHCGCTGVDMFSSVIEQENPKGIQGRRR